MKQQLLFALKLATLTGVYLFTRSRTPANKLTNPAKSLAVLYVLENLKRVLVQNGRLVRDAENQVQILENDILLFKAFLADSAKKSDGDGALEEFAAQIQGVVCEAEAVIAAFSNLAAENRARNFFVFAFAGPMKLISVAKEVRAVRAKVKVLYDKSKGFSATGNVGRGGA
ncbi:hypothetical protein ACP275_09G010700 [Erythranthe tilingii]